MTATTARIAVTILLFELAVVISYFGLGLGLRFSPVLETPLWFAAAAMVALNLFWTVRSRG